MTGAAARFDALVVFTGEAEMRWLRLLKPGFRHCFVLLRRGGVWVELQPLAHCLRVSAGGGDPAGEAFFSLAAARGWTVIPARCRAPAPRLAPIRPLTCVEVVKRALGLRAPGVWTPWSLYRALTTDLQPSKNRKKFLDSRRRMA